MADSDQLRQLNVDTFTAEAKGKVGEEDWDKFLRRVLAKDFRIRRANPAIPLQDPDAMLAHIEKSEPVKRKVSDVKMFEDGVYGVVTCVIMLEGQSDRFHNIKVFTRRPPGDWQCAYWHVSKMTGQ